MLKAHKGGSAFFCLKEVGKYPLLSAFNTTSHIHIQTTARMAGLQY
jgi:hypothetical protein